MKKLRSLAIAGTVLLAGLTSCTKALQDGAPANAAASSSSTNGTMTIQSLLFDGSASLGSAAVWKDINIEGTGTVTTINDETSTLCWKFLKPAGSHRTEGHGAKNYQAVVGDEIYIGWTCKLYMPTTLQTDAVFQWKSYPTDTFANHPLMLRTKNGNLELQHFDENHTATVPWSIPLSTSTWQKFVLRMKMSKDGTVGYIELWYNGTKQTFTNGSQRLYCRTYDSNYCDPKWGVYGGDDSQATNIVKNIKIASTYADAAQ